MLPSMKMSTLQFSAIFYNYRQRRRKLLPGVEVEVFVKEIEA
jgi:hypothetical protein